jgi:putative DNA primase/helicase
MMADHPNPATLEAIRHRVGGHLYDGGRRLLCPGPGHSRKDRSLSVKLGVEGQPVVHSFSGDDLAACFDHLGVRPKTGRKMTTAERQREEAARRRDWEDERQRKLLHCRQVWEESVPADQTLVEIYLRSRAIKGAIPSSLRFHPSVPGSYAGAGRGPAMVARVDNAAGQLVALHVTFLRPDGEGKADSGGTAKLMFGSPVGSAVRLFDGPSPDTLAVVEGIETGLSYMALKGVPVLACLSAIGLKRLQMPSGVSRVAVAADGDEAGRNAALGLIARINRQCETAVDGAPEGKDWNDVLQEANQ